jgi:hypothetical protein
VVYRNSTGLFLILALLGFVLCFGQGSLNQLYRYDFAGEHKPGGWASLASGQSVDIAPAHAPPLDSELLAKVIFDQNEPRPILELRTGTETFLPVSAPPGQVHFRFRTPERARAIRLVNQSPLGVTIHNLILQNYSMVNTGFPAFAVLLGAGPEVTVHHLEDWKKGALLGLFLLMLLWPLISQLFLNGLEPPRMVLLLAPVGIACLLNLILWLAASRLLLGPDSFLIMAWLGPILLLLTHPKVIVWLAFWLTRPVTWCFAVLAWYLFLLLDFKFENQGFGPESLPLMCDWLSNFIYQGRPFWVDQLGLNHLNIQLNPSLILLAPLFFIFDSQYVFAILLALAFLAALLMLLRISAMVLDRLDVSGWAKELSLCGLVFGLGLNPFSLALIEAAHYELFFVLLSVSVFYLLCRNTGGAWLAVFTLLLLGTRQDAGIFFFFMLASVALAPSPLLAYKRRIVIKSGVLMLLCLAYAIPALIFTQSPYDCAESYNCWSYLGRDWAGAVGNFFSQPQTWLPYIKQSAFIPLNLSLGGVQLLSAHTWIISGLPGFMIFIAEPEKYRFLQSSLSAFLLPGLLISMLFGLYWLGRALKKGRVMACLLVCLGLAGLNLNQAYQLKGPDFGIFRQSQPASPNQKNTLRNWLYHHPKVESLALDHTVMAYAPLKLKRFGLVDHAQADAVVFTKSSPKNIEAELLNQKEHSLAYELPGLRIYVRKTGP